MAWLRLFSHGIHGIHRSFVALVLPQNSRNSQKFYCVAFFYKLRECSVGGASLPKCSVCSVRSVGDIPVCFVGAVLALTGGKVELRLLDSGGSVGMAGCHTLLICAHPCQSVGGASLPEGSVCSVRSVGDIPVCFVGAVLALAVGKAELRLLDSGGSVGMAGCHTLLICAHPCQSVGDTSLPEGSVLSVRSVGI